MRVGPKKALSTLRWGTSGVPGPYTVERPQDRENYQDGDRSLAELWNTRPYQDVEQPHMDADPDIDAEDTDEPAKRLNMEPVVRRAVMELVAEDEEEDRDKDKYLDQSGAFGGGLWSTVAPLVNTVLDLMRMVQDADQLRSKIQSSSIRKKELLQVLADKAEKAGFGYRTDKKDWDRFMLLVPSVTGLLKDEHNRNLLKNALGEWVSEEGKIKQHGFAGAPSPDDWGFEPFVPTGGGGTDTQEYYEGYVPGAVPRQETYNVERMVALAKGQVGSKMSSEVLARLKDRRIVDFDTAEVNTKRLQSLLRYVVDQPDSQLAMSIVVGTIVREVFRYISTNAEEAIEFDGDKVRDLKIDPDKLLSGMQDGTKRVVEEWLNIAISIMSLVGVLPKSEPEEGEEDAEYYKADILPRYKPIQNRMRYGLAKIALEIAKEAIQSMKVNLEGPDEIPVATEDEVSDTWAAFDDALRESKFDVAVEMAQKLHNIASTPGLDLPPARLSSSKAAVEELAELVMGGEPDNATLRKLRNEIVAPLREAIRDGKLGASKAASTTVADIAKRIVSPAKVRVVTRDEVEDGIELDGGDTLELPKRHVRRMIGG